MHRELYRKCGDSGRICITLGRCLLRKCNGSLVGMFVSPVLSLSLSLSFLHDLWVLVLLVLLVLRSEVGERRLASVLLLPVPPRNQLVCLCVCVYFWRGGGGACRSPSDVQCPICQEIARTYMMFSTISDALPSKECV